MIVVDKGPLIRQFLEEGRHVSIEGGILNINPPIPGDQYKSDFESMASEIINTCGVGGFAYRGYTTGLYIAGKAPGVNLQFINLQGDGSSAFAIFNAEINRTRRGKKGGPGTPLPKGQFRVGVNHGFYRFWVKAGIDLPPRLSSFHDYMGKLKFRILTGKFVKPSSEKLINQTLEPLTLTHDQIAYEFCIERSVNCHTVGGQFTDIDHPMGILCSDYNHTDHGQFPDDFHTSMPDMDIAQSEEWWKLERSTTTGANHYEDTSPRVCGHADIPGYEDAETRESDAELDNPF